MAMIDVTAVTLRFQDISAIFFSKFPPPPRANEEPHFGKATLPRVVTHLPPETPSGTATPAESKGGASKIFLIGSWLGHVIPICHVWSSSEEPGGAGAGRSYRGPDERQQEHKEKMEAGKVEGGGTCRWRGQDLNRARFLYFRSRSWVRVSARYVSARGQTRPEASDTKVVVLSRRYRGGVSVPERLKGPKK